MSHTTAEHLIAQSIQTTSIVHAEAALIAALHLRPHPLQHLLNARALVLQLLQLFTRLRVVLLHGHHLLPIEESAGGEGRRGGNRPT